MASKRKKGSRKNSHKMKTVLYSALAAFAVIIFIFWWFCLTPMATGEKKYFVIDKDDTADSIVAKVSEQSDNSSGKSVFRFMMKSSGMFHKVHTGWYTVYDINALRLFLNVRGGMQSPIDVTVLSCRTKEKLCKTIARNLAFSPDELERAISSEKICAEYGYTPATIFCMFIPNTYDVYYDTTAPRFLDRMKKEHDRFWNDDRKHKAEAMGMTEIEIYTLASIVDEETANDAEKPMIAGLYYNRLKKGIKLQADPTVKFAMGDWGIRRVLNYMLKTPSPYNTYYTVGLPPGPIRVASVEGIEAVLNHAEHDYIFMCAKEDFSGTHNFAKTEQEHMENARKYQAALDARNIKK